MQICVDNAPAGTHMQENGVSLEKLYILERVKHSPLTFSVKRQ